MIRLFEVENGVVKVTEHCYVIGWLKAIMEKFPEPEKYLRVYAYIFYMSYPGQENPYFNVNESIRPEIIAADINLDFNTEEDCIIKAIERAIFLYTTPTARAHKAITKMLDNISDYISTAKVTTGRDGNLIALTRLAEKFDEIRKSHKSITKDLEEEQHAVVHGGQNLAYDQGK